MPWLTKTQLDDLGVNFDREFPPQIDDTVRIVNPDLLTMGAHSRIDAFCFLSGKINIGRNVHISSHSSLSGNFNIIIGDFVTISGGCKFYTANSDYGINPQGMTNPTIPKKFRSGSGGSITIEKHVMLGANTTVLPSTILPQGSVYGAYTLAKGLDYSPWKRYVGVPAKLLGVRKKDLVIEAEKQLLRAELDPTFYR